jgi:hypothetical protein
MLLVAEHVCGFAGNLNEVNKKCGQCVLSESSSTVSSVASWGPSDGG